ncbi:phospholipase D-like domain-containing protein [Clostridium hydrogenum]|uniref:phospholipase D-like domain-containing protein n=1 Tax=Clostridium hydrogenum TaxID=2855764 RepID=UPI001F4535A5|nr:phospholipase D-like domain-containing protein [Clostridium hydrogenum]
MNKTLSKTITVITMCAMLAGCASVKAATKHNKKHHKAKTTVEQTQSTTSTSTTAQQNTSSGNISYYFPRDNGQPDKRLIDIINNSKSSLDIAIYSITKKDIVDSIISAKKRGLIVRLITDGKESESKSEAKELSLLKNAGIPIKVNTHTGLMHLKVTIADSKIVTTGSYNYTNDASFKNDEVLVVLNDVTVAKQFETEFTRMWNDNSNFKEY